MSPVSPLSPLSPPPQPHPATHRTPGERLVGELAPELAPLLSTIQMPANFIPLTNDVLAEMQRRGVTRDALLVALQRMGAELPPASVRMLQGARARSIDIKVLSDCNSVFIGHMLAGARLQNVVEEVITNGASFERVATCADDAIGIGVEHPAAAPSQNHHQQQSKQSKQHRSSSHRLVIRPRRPEPHDCPLCPSNLCKGEEVVAIQRSGAYARIVYAGDGANDICPALTLKQGDVVLARAGHALAAYASGAEGARLRAEVHLWDTHDQLALLVDRFSRSSSLKSHAFVD